MKHREKAKGQKAEGTEPKKLNVVAVPEHLRDKFTLCAWHPGGKAMVEKHTGRKLTEKEIDEHGLRGVNSDGACKPCYARAMEEIQEMPLDEGPIKK